MVQAPTQSVTLKKFLELPETKPAREYINGLIFQKPMPQGKHSILQRELSFALTAAFRNERKDKQIAQAFPELRCTFGGRSIVPDIAVFLNQRIPQDPDGDVANAFNLHPDWTIEILSPNQSHTRVVRNILHCLDNGTEMGWLIDPDEFCLFVYDSDKSVQSFENTDITLPVPAFAQSLQLKVGDIFSWLKV
ncbi:Uma2 family endonuclease [Leptolyngbya cf. ectocarpi LEGE 11479]|uniref:Uma2 family endonuclease n=1 Tax=Leptolyngbya cf. ectocarpi LEGE 11479 TaxID=1828722 RepID=A0A928ZTE9_LEPEC|nr:Uma2 family endonuclease [Leptolyngbya ectocarpi]MBE9067211.1 Uma2 family endonuclease [Leptolyngbya cf. ectocarpi LEGE 11479]